MQCKYVKRDGSICPREALPDSEKGFCILHEDWEHKKEEETKKEFYREIEEGITDFEGCILSDISLFGITIGGDFSFLGATIEGTVMFTSITIEGDLCFDEATINGHAGFSGIRIKGNARFERAIIDGYAGFNGITIERNAWFTKATIGGRAAFVEATINNKVDFSHSNISYLTFENAKFNTASGQENACRAAKITQERAGDRALADYHFYREMEAKRKQKHPIIRVLELPVQYIFGYGVHPWRVIATWLLTAFSLAFVYWLGNGVEAADSLVENIYFSVVTAATPGYGGYHPNPGFYQGLASFEAIFGTFMWAAFIATFARKYMR